MNLLVKIVFLALLLSLFYSKSVNANVVSFGGEWVEHAQTDGTVIKIKPNGDSRDHWLEDEKGFALEMYQDNLVYIRRDYEDKILAQERAPVDAITSKEKWINFKPNDTKFHEPEIVEDATGRSLSSRFQVVEIKDKQPLLIVGLEFSDQELIYSAQEHLQRFYGPGPSAADYFLKSSFNKFTISRAKEHSPDSPVPGGVTNDNLNDGYIRVSLNDAQPNKLGTNPKEGETRIIQYGDSILGAIDPYIDFKKYDSNFDGRVTPRELAILLIISGYEGSNHPARSPSTWGHFWDVPFNSSQTKYDDVLVWGYSAFGEKNNDNSKFRAGIVVHELGHHILGLPDLYSGNRTRDYGRWGLMAANVNPPVDFSAWSKDQIGFLKPRVFSGSSDNVTLRASDVAPDAYKIWLDPYKHNEYLLLEYRKKRGINQSIPGSGILVTHVKEHHSSFNRLEENQTKSVLGILDNGRPFKEGSRLVNPRTMDGGATDVVIDNIRFQNDSTASFTVSNSFQDMDSLGYNEAVHLDNTRAIYPSKFVGEEAALVMKVNNTAAWADGVDLARHDNKFTNVVVRLASSLENIQKGEFLGEALTTRVQKKGWSRFKFSQSIPIRNVSPIYVHILYRDNPWYVEDAGLVKNKKTGEYDRENFFFHLHDKNNHRIEPSPYTNGFSYRLLVRGLAPNSPPIVGKSTVEIPVNESFYVEKSLFKMSDPDGTEGAIVMRGLSLNDPGVTVASLNNGFNVFAPSSYVGKTVEGKLTASDDWDEITRAVSVRFIAGAASDVTQPNGDEPSTGGSSTAGGPSTANDNEEECVPTAENPDACEEGGGALGSFSLGLWLACVLILFRKRRFY